MLIPAGWYVVAAANELKRQKPLAIKRFEQDIVLWRENNGSAVGMIDRCPHRSAKLSCGAVKDNLIECGFHGFKFDADGQCQLVPETQKAAPNLKVETLAVAERHGFIWIWHGSEKPQSEISWFEELSDKHWSYSQQSTEWPIHVTRCIENQLDYAHLPFVHRNSIGQGMDVTKQVKFETCEEFIKFYPSGDGPQKSFIEFRFPNIWMLSIVPGKFAQMMAFVPVSENMTKLYLRGYQTFANWPGVSTIFNTIGAWQSRYILNQDKRVVLTQHPNSSLDAKDEVLYQSDTGIKFFRERWLRKKD
ncbi:MAG TPA: aromatic ring-hydroxylating dioxygenase subunit alpha [Candidatus Melainabacteria bacterium]|nr:aromatic ring-hydroxylating dioxygenase subunit alpha [Candidatus Melainabacteria bacterium]